MFNGKKIDVKDLYLVKVGVVKNKKNTAEDYYTYELEFLKYAIVRRINTYGHEYEDVITNEVYGDFLGEGYENGDISVNYRTLKPVSNILREINKYEDKKSKKELAALAEAYNIRYNEILNGNIVSFEKQELKQIVKEIQTVMTKEQLIKIKEIIEKSNNESIKKVLELK